MTPDAPYSEVRNEPGNRGREAERAPIFVLRYLPVA
jgi:hypothetical protein